MKVSKFDCCNSFSPFEISMEHMIDGTNMLVPGMDTIGAMFCYFHYIFASTFLNDLNPN